MHQPRRLLSLVAAFVVIAASCTPSDQAVDEAPEPPAQPEATPPEPTPAPEDPEPEPMFEEDECEFDAPAGRTVDCGWLSVPENRDDPEANTIRLHVAVFASESASPSPDAVVYLEGGPGGDALETVPLTFEDRFAHLLVDRDVVFFDQRGTGYSQPSLACPELRELGLDLIDEDLPVEEAIARQAEAIEECRTRLVDSGVDLSGYNSAESAADLADLRVALGYDEWNVYGISYGTRLALTTLRDHPEGIRSVVLDSVYPPEVDILGETPANLDRALDTLFAGCAADETCRAAYPDLESTFFELVETLDETPIRAPVTDVFTGETYDAVFTGGGIGGVVFQSLYSADAITVIPRMIDNISRGDTYELSVLTSSFLANGEFVSAGMQFSVQCNEEAGFTSESIVDAAIDDYGELATIFEGSANLGGQFFATCATWDSGVAAPVENEPVASAIPALVTAGEYDPITPPSWATLAAASLGSSVYVEFPGVGHGPTADRECPQSILRAFLNNPTASPDLSCVDEMPSPAFVGAQIETPAVTLVPFEEGAFGPTVTGLTPEGWEPAGPGVWSRGVDGLDQTVLIQQFAAGAPAETLLSLVGGQFGLASSPEPVETFDSESGEWSIYQGELIGAPVSVAVLDTDAGSALVVLVTPPAEREALVDAVLFPVLEAFQAG